VAKAVSDDRAFAGKIPTPVHDLVRRTMECGSGGPIGIGKIIIASYVDHNRRRFRAEPGI